MASSRERSLSRQPLLRRRASMGSSEVNEIEDNAIEMSSNGIHIDGTKSDRIKKNLNKYEQLFGIDEESSCQPTTSKKELWSYYLYYNVSANLLLGFLYSNWRSLGRQWSRAAKLFSSPLSKCSE